MSTEPTAPIVQRTADRAAAAPAVVATRPSIWRIAVGVLLGMLAYTLVMIVATALLGATLIGLIASQVDDSSGSPESPSGDPAQSAYDSAKTGMECEIIGGSWDVDAETCQEP